MDKNLSHKVRRLSRMELPGAGQVYVTGNTAYVGHITNRAQLGTSILDISDPTDPCHKVRVIGDVTIVNVEQNLGALAAWFSGGLRIVDAAA